MRLSTLGQLKGAALIFLAVWMIWLGCCNKSEALHALTAAKVGQSLTRGDGNTYLIDRELGDRGNVLTHSRNLRGKVGPFTFDGESDMGDGLRAEKFESLFKIDTALSDAIFGKEIARETAEDRDARESCEGMAESVKDNVAIRFSIKPGVAFEDYARYYTRF